MTSLVKLRNDESKKRQRKIKKIKNTLETMNNIRYFELVNIGTGTPIVAPRVALSVGLHTLALVSVALSSAVALKKSLSSTHTLQSCSHAQ